MNFTREPIIETIITPKDGFRLVIRSSKGPSQEEYSVEALEVVSFGHTQFYRSLEKPKCFLLPISDYEVVETREAKIVLKNPAIEKTIKIAGGKEQNHKPTQKEVHAHEPQEASQEGQEEELETVFEKRKDKKKNRRKKAQEMRNQEKEHENKSEEKQSAELPHVKKENSEEQVPTPMLFSSLLPPPTTLISETIGRYKAMESSENFMHTRQPNEIVEATESIGNKEEDVSTYVQTDSEELDQIWSQKLNEETFVSSSRESQEPQEAKEEILEDEGDKAAEMDIDKFIE